MRHQDREGRLPKYRPRRVRRKEALDARLIGRCVLLPEVFDISTSTTAGRNPAHRRARQDDRGSVPCAALQRPRRLRQPHFPRATSPRRCIAPIRSGHAGAAGPPAERPAYRHGRLGHVGWCQPSRSSATTPCASTAPPDRACARRNRSTSPDHRRSRYVRPAGLTFGTASRRIRTDAVHRR